MFKKVLLIAMSCVALTACSQAPTVAEQDKESYEFCVALDKVDDALVGKWSKAYLKSFTYPDTVTEDEWKMLYWVSEQGSFDFVLNLPDTYEAETEDLETFKQYVKSTWEYNQALAKYTEQMEAVSGVPYDAADLTPSITEGIPVDEATDAPLEENIDDEGGTLE